MFMLVQSTNINLWFIVRFLFKVVVDIPNKKSLSIEGKQERDHAHAKDSAAYNMLVELQKHRLCSINNFNNDFE